MIFLPHHFAGFVLKLYGICTKFSRNLTAPFAKQHSINLVSCQISLGIRTPILKFSSISGVNFIYSGESVSFYTAVSYVGFSHVPGD